MSQKLIRESEIEKCLSELSDSGDVLAELTEKLQQIKPLLLVPCGECPSYVRMEHIRADASGLVSGSRRIFPAATARKMNGGDGQSSDPVLPGMPQFSQPGSFSRTDSNLHLAMIE